MVIGSGYRGTVEQLTPADRERVRRENLDFIHRTSLRSLESNVVYATAVKVRIETAQAWPVLQAREAGNSIKPGAQAPGS